MKNRVIGLMVFVILAVPGVSESSDTATGKITRIGGGQVSGHQPSVYFGLDTAPANRPACSNHSDYYYVLDPSTDEGKALYSALLSARAMDRSVSVKGTGICGMGQPMETISYWISH